MRDAGCQMIFFGAESGNDEVLQQMNKGGKQSGKQILEFAARMKKFGIIPEYSFVLGTPADSPEKVIDQIDKDIAFIKKVKAINPDTEIIIYVYSPVPVEGSELFDTALGTGFSFPTKLEEWLNPEWQQHDLRKTPMAPWLTRKMVQKILDFDTVLHGRFPTKSDFHITPLQRGLLKLTAGIRYHTNLMAYPYEIKAMQRFWRYTQPEIAGFYQE